jgi:hypothetical protein
MKSPDIAVIYDESLPSENFEEFQKELADQRLNIAIESKPLGTVYASLEWFIPTAITVFIGKSYFDGFLKEAGKDHYQALKNKLAKLTKKEMSKPRIEPIIMSSQEGKVSKNNPYSMAFSIYAEANDGNTFKLLIPKPADTNDYTEIIHKFLEFLNDFHSGIKNEQSIGFDMDTKPPSRTIFVHMNPETKIIEWLDYRAQR